MNRALLLKSVAARIGIGPWAAPETGQDPLARVAADVAAAFADVKHIDIAALAERLRDGGDHFLLFDTRTPAEFEVSHLAGAINVAPATSADRFRQDHAPRIAGRDCIFYCAVGVRSATLAQRIAPVARAAGVGSVANLRGGIFAWHNSGGPLVNAAGRAIAVHSYGGRWHRFLRDGATPSPKSDHMGRDIG
jgi:rhodanese-related sulfurtransferase